ncbi:helix-turn-helix domain-containing protein [Solirubrobacter sp. CPCC 204708]|nr:helix-turn-helix domain-containing protein [Solirubrobacter deserti]
MIAGGRSAAATCRLSSARRSAILKAQGVGIRETARWLGRSPSTISWELRRNAATRCGRLENRASVAQWKAELIARRPKTAKLVPTSVCASTCRSAWPERSVEPTGHPRVGRRHRHGRAATSPVVRTASK